jgi:hypothetical protein
MNHRRRIAKPAPAWPIGTPVLVRRDDGTLLETVTRSAPWQMAHGDWVVLVKGITGCYLADRITAKADIQTPETAGRR